MDGKEEDVIKEELPSAVDDAANVMSGHDPFDEEDCEACAI